MRRLTSIAVLIAALSFAACDRTSSESRPTSTPTTSPTATAPAAATATVTGTPTSTPAAASATPGAAATPKDASYLIENRVVTLKGGVSEVEAAPGAASKIVTRYFGNEATGDLNGDGVADVLFVLTQSPGGSGTFFYVVAAVKTSAGWVGTNGVLLGDRIAPQSTQYRDGTAIVNYADRKPGEPMTAQPSIGVSKTFKVVDAKLVAQ
jgi:hypothetical protein